MRIRTITRAEDFGNLAAMKKSYRDAPTAEKAVEKYLGGKTWYRNTTVTAIPVQRGDGRFVPVCIFQGDDRMQACIDTARHGFMSFA